MIPKIVVGCGVKLIKSGELPDSRSLLHMENEDPQPQVLETPGFLIIN
jgi:hypothetical protein